MDHIYYIPYSIKTVYREPANVPSSAYNASDEQCDPFDLLPRMIWIRIMSKLRIRDVLNMSEINSSLVRFSKYQIIATMDLAKIILKIILDKKGNLLKNHSKNSWQMKITFGKNYTGEILNRILMSLKISAIF